MARGVFFSSLREAVVRVARFSVHAWETEGGCSVPLLPFPHGDFCFINFLSLFPVTGCQFVVAVMAILIVPRPRQKTAAVVSSSHLLVALVAQKVPSFLPFVSRLFFPPSSFLVEDDEDVWRPAVCSSLPVKDI